MYMCTCIHMYKYTCIYHNFIGWIDTSEEIGKGRLVFCQLVVGTSDEAEQISFALRIEEDFSWSVLFHQKRIEACSCQVLSSFSSTLRSADEVGKVIHALDTSIICEGNPDEKFAHLSASRKGIFKDQAGVLNNYFMYIHVGCDAETYKHSTFSICML